MIPRSIISSEYAKDCKTDVKEPEAEIIEQEIPEDSAITANGTRTEDNRDIQWKELAAIYFMLKACGSECNGKVVHF